jgi:formylglycine-generating enzyme required for sulfatase activity
MLKLFVSAALLLLFSLSSLWPDDFAAYEEKIPNTNESFKMVAIPAGSFLMGSPDSETGRNEDEGPQRKVNLSAFWMGSHEVTWDLYLIYQNRELEIDKSQAVDAVSRPTKPYVEMSFGQGKNGGFPVCNITQYAARSFCKWLYQKTGHFYRLPTEAEWEYAARAGTTTPWYFGFSENNVNEYAWSYLNSDGAYQRTGQKKPNELGLFDMYGNVAEWTSDQYLPDYFQRIKDGVKDPYFAPDKLYPHTIKGGHWDDDAAQLRSAYRKASAPKLKQRDPQIPRSDWWLTDAPFLGFRVVRPLVEPSKDEIEAYYAAPPKDK